MDRQNSIQILNLVRSENTLGVREPDWRGALATAKADSAVGIRHAEISGDSNYRVHVAAIPDQVGCHVHRIGDEDYAVVEGEGDLHFGRTTQGPRGLVVEDKNWREVEVTAGDSFVIPEGYAHQLRKKGSGDLTILCGCPDSHLNDDEDRTMLPDAPGR